MPPRVAETNPNRVNKPTIAMITPTISSLRSKERLFQKEETDNLLLPRLVLFFPFDVLLERDRLVDRRVEAARVFELVFLDRDADGYFRFCAISLVSGQIRGTAGAGFSTRIFPNITLDHTPGASKL